jgi:hypothetical protein
MFNQPLGPAMLTAIARLDNYFEAYFPLQPITASQRSQFYPNKSDQSTFQRPPGIKKMIVRTREREKERERERERERKIELEILQL